MNRRIKKKLYKRANIKKYKNVTNENLLLAMARIVHSISMKNAWVFSHASSNTKGVRK